MYNRGNIIPETLNSIFQQEVFSFDYEIIIVDDGSTDESVRICQEIAAKHPQMSIITQKNEGPGAARNKGLSKAQGEYIWFVDSDDWIVPQAFAKLQQYVNKEYDAITISSANVIDNTNRRRISYGHLVGRILSGQDFIDQRISVNAFSFSFRLPISLHNIVFNRKFLLRNSLLMLPGIYHEDLEFLPRVFFYTKQMIVNDDILYLVRQTPGSIVRSVTPKKAFDNLTVARSLSVFIGEHRSACNRKLYVIAGIAISNALEEIWKTKDWRNHDFLTELRKHSRIYKSALLRTYHLKFILLAVLLAISPSAMIYVYNKLQIIKRK